MQKIFVMFMTKGPTFNNIMKNLYNLVLKGKTKKTQKPQHKIAINVNRFQGEKSIICIGNRDILCSSF